jgi:hypothetical protein
MLVKVGDLFVAANVKLVERGKKEKREERGGRVDVCDRRKGVTLRRRWWWIGERISWRRPFCGKNETLEMEDRQ